MKSYCVKERRQTEWVEGLEVIATAKNGRLMMKCRCASCGIIKTKFVSQEEAEELAKKVGISQMWRSRLVR